MSEQFTVIYVYPFIIRKIYETKESFTINELSTRTLLSYCSTTSLTKRVFGTHSSFLKVGVGFALVHLMHLSLPKICTADPLLNFR